MNWLQNNNRNIYYKNSSQQLLDSSSMSKKKNRCMNEFCLHDTYVGQVNCKILTFAFFLLNLFLSVKESIRLAIFFPVVITSSLAESSCVSGKSAEFSNLSFNLIFFNFRYSESLICKRFSSVDLTNSR